MVWNRIIPSILYILSMFITLYCAFKNSIILVFLAVLVQIASFIWYILTYIPYAQQGIVYIIRYLSAF